MTNNQNPKPNNLQAQVNTNAPYTEAERLKNTQWYEASTPQPLQSNTIIKAKIIAITPKHVLLDTNSKFDGIISLTEFKDRPDLKVQDEVEVYVESIEGKKNQITLSRKKLEAIKGWKIIEQAFASQQPIEITIIRTSPGGLIGSINGIEVFLPGSQIDLKTVADHDAFVNTKLQVMVLNVTPAKKNVIVSRKLILKKNLEEQKKAIIETLEEGQILEGVVKNIEKYGAFIDLGGGLTGLVYITDMTWKKWLDNPSQAIDEQGMPMFEKGKKVKVVVMGIDRARNHISLTKRPLLTNPWERVDQEIQENNIISCKVTKIMDYYVILETDYGVEATMHSSEMSLAPHAQNPKDLVAIGQELQAMVLHKDVEKQILKLGIKQLMDSPWKNEDFPIKFALNTRHQAKVIRFTPHGADLELDKNVYGELKNRHLSWTQKINNANKILQKGKTYEVIIIGIDESKEVLELGYRELQESPWSKFEQTFIPGSIHKGTIIANIPQGVIIQLQEGPETFISNKDLTKKEKTNLEVGKELDFMVIDFMRYEEKIRVSHNTSSTPTKKHSRPINFTTAGKTTLGDITLVNDSTKEQPADNEKPAKQPKETTTTTAEIKEEKEQKEQDNAETKATKDINKGSAEQEKAEEPKKIKTKATTKKATKKKEAKQTNKAEAKEEKTTNQE